jgi:hypothetical protein
VVVERAGTEAGKTSELILPIRVLGFSDQYGDPTAGLEPTGSEAERRP